MKTLEDRLHETRKMLRRCLNVFKKIVDKNLHKSLKIHTSRTHRVRESIRRKRPQYWHSDDWYLLPDMHQYIYPNWLQSSWLKLSLMGSHIPPNHQT
ncbi:hypothetical protein TNCV_4229241 [Trichonephila clavipes]|nr:hypothetical protein TNCV_4229241 [Trichonephila clavipes]